MKKSIAVFLGITLVASAVSAIADVKAPKDILKYNDPCKASRETKRLYLENNKGARIYLEVPQGYIESVDDEEGGRQTFISLKTDNICNSLDKYGNQSAQVLNSITRITVRPSNNKNFSDIIGSRLTGLYPLFVDANNEFITFKGGSNSVFETRELLLPTKQDQEHLYCVECKLNEREDKHQKYMGCNTTSYPRENLYINAHFAPENLAQSKEISKAAHAFVSAFIVTTQEEKNGE